MLGTKVCDLCPYKDLEKSKPSVNADGSVSNPESLTFCKAINDWVYPFTPCEGEAVLNGTKYQLKCERCGNILVSISIKGNVNSANRYNFRYTQFLLAYRQRPDKEVGLECICGQDTRLSDHKKDDDAKNQLIEAKKARFPKGLAKNEIDQRIRDILDDFVTKKEVANWNSSFSKFKLELEV